MILVELVPCLHRPFVGKDIVKNDKATHRNKAIQVVEGILVGVVKVAIHTQNSQLHVGILVLGIVPWQILAVCL